MDNFMDKLTKRFNAGEMILANGEAEARETDRLKKQVEENEKVLQEIRRLNLKTVEISEQVSQMAAASIEQIESYTAPNTEPGRFADEEEIEHVKTQLMQISDRAIDTYRLADDLSHRIDEVSRKSDDLGRKADEVGMQVGNASLQLKKDISDAAYRMDATLSQIEEDVVQNRRSVERALQQLSADLQNQQPQKLDSEELVKSLEETMEKQTELVKEEAKQMKEMLASLRLYTEEVQKHIEDYVHKEDVKVYRNVQAVITQQFSDRTRELNVRMDQMEASSGKGIGAGVKVLLVLTFLLSAGSLTIQVLQMLGIL